MSLAFIFFQARVYKHRGGERAEKPSSVGRDSRQLNRTTTRDTEGRHSRQLQRTTTRDTEGRHSRQLRRTTTRYTKGRHSRQLHRTTTRDTEYLTTIDEIPKPYRNFIRRRFRRMKKCGHVILYTICLIFVVSFIINDIYFDS